MLSRLYRPGLWALGLIVVAALGIGAKAADDRGWVHRPVDPETGEVAGVRLDTGAATADVRAAYDAARQPIDRLWAGLESNPGPVLFALGTFVLTVVYHVARGRSVREAIESAATRQTTIVHLPERPAPASVPEESRVVARARAEVLWAQLVEDQTRIKSRREKLPEEIKAVQQLAMRTGAQLAAARADVEAKERINADAVGRLASLNAERIKADVELAEIGREIDRLQLV